MPNAKKPLHGLEHLLEAVDRKNKRISDMLASYNGDPCGIEFRHGELEQWGFILPDASEPGRFRFQNFDLKGFIGHATHNTIESAFVDMAKSGFVIEDIGALDRLSATPLWAEGTEAADLLRMLNGGDISFNQYLESREQIAIKYRTAETA